MHDVSTAIYPERLQTFEGFWDQDQSTAHQLAAIGHVYDRPPLEALEQGSRCITCSAFVKRDLSIAAFGDRSSDDFDDIVLHHPRCLRLQVRIPLDPHAGPLAGRSFHMQDLRAHWERRAGSTGRTVKPSQRVSQTSSLFNLPVELRLQIYSMILPSLDRTTEIVPLNRDSPRVVTSIGYRKTGPRDTSKSNILCSCRAVNEEALDILYSHTTFAFSSSKVLYLFLRSVGQAGRNLLTSVDIHCGGREDAIAFALLACCGKLRSITIRLPRPVLLFPGGPPWMVDGMAALLALRGLDEVKFAAYRHLPNAMTAEQRDGKVILRELQRPRGEPGDFSSLRK